MSGKSVRVESRSVQNFPIKSLKDFQGNLKKLSPINYQKLRDRILELGFSEPVTIFQHDGKNYLLNGHQRVRTLRKMRREGYEVPSEIPCSIASIETPEEAKKVLLALTSQFGVILDTALEELARRANVSLEELSTNYHFPEVDTDALIQKGKEAAESLEIERDEVSLESDLAVYQNNPIKRLVLAFSDVQYGTVLENLDELLGKYECEDYSELFKRLVFDATN